MRQRRAGIVPPKNGCSRPALAPRIAVCVALLLAIANPATSQINNPAYADYLLVGRFGEICTMCEAIVLCEASDALVNREQIPDSGSYVVYHLQTRTFWSQIGTIWEWFIANFDSDSLATAGHTRPVVVYQIDDGHWSQPETIEARLALDPATIVVDHHVIDRVERHWLTAPNSATIGYCQRMPLWDSLDHIAVETTP